MSEFQGGGKPSGGSSKSKRKSATGTSQESLTHKGDSRQSCASVATLRAAVYGAAVGDALGVPYEFRGRESFTCVTMDEGGTHEMPRGTFSDDTSLLLATCDSIRATGRIDVDDMQKRFRQWLYKGKYTSDGRVFDVGNTVATALDRGRGCTGEYSNGNGSLMRIAPLAFTKATDEEIESVSAITHAHSISKSACVAFVHILREVAFSRSDLLSAIENNVPADEAFEAMRNLKDMPREEVSSGGYVVDTLCAALWCALHTESYADCVLEAVNLGRDTDTTACVAGALAGVMYGYDAIPKEWIEALRGKKVIESCLFD